MAAQCKEELLNEEQQYQPREEFLASEILKHGPIDPQTRVLVEVLGEMWEKDLVLQQDDLAKCIAWICINGAAFIEEIVECGSARDMGIDPRNYEMIHAMLYAECKPCILKRANANNPADHYDDTFHQKW